ncbi:MAG: hypothetical protein JNM17_26920 [Archangium sp.]|nr:hypothetical protein [Archangium sp.]
MVRLTTSIFAVVLLSACGPRELRVTMNADNNSGQTGFATLEDLGNTVRVTVETSLPDYITDKGQAAHIHKGNCGEVGSNEGGIGPLKVLQRDPSRVGATNVFPRPMSTFKEGDWLINVHDERDTLIYVSCGEIPKP